MFWPTIRVTNWFLCTWARGVMGVGSAVKRSCVLGGGVSMWVVGGSVVFGRLSSSRLRRWAAGCDTPLWFPVHCSSGVWFVPSVGCFCVWWGWWCFWRGLGAFSGRVECSYASVLFSFLLGSSIVFGKRGALTTLTMSLLFATPICTTSRKSNRVRFGNRIVRTPYRVRRSSVSGRIRLNRIAADRVGRSRRDSTITISLHLIGYSLRGSDGNSNNGVSGITIAFSDSTGAANTSPVLGGADANRTANINMHLVGGSRDGVILNATAPSVSLTPASDRRALGFFT